MSNNKQSSIEFLLDKIQLSQTTFTDSDGNKYIFLYPILNINDIEQCKEMHKEEIENAQMDMFICLNELPYSLQYLEKRQSAEDFATHYYNETFGGNNEQQ